MRGPRSAWDAAGRRTDRHYRQERPRATRGRRGGAFLRSTEREGRLQCQRMRSCWDGGRLTLLEEDHVLLVQTEVSLLLEESFRLWPRRPTRHNIPPNPDAPVLVPILALRHPRELGDPPRLQCKQGRLGGQTNVIHPFRERRPQPGSLAAREQEHRNRVIRDSLQANLAPFRLFRLVVNDRGAVFIPERSPLGGRRGGRGTRATDKVA
jgi:hypothetical protein